MIIDPVVGVRTKGIQIHGIAAVQSTKQNDDGIVSNALYSL